MKTMTPRLENAVTKLYNAFHANELNGMSCTQCAVGNMCGNSKHWSSIAPTIGYAMYELKIVESLFMFGKKKLSEKSKWDVGEYQDKEIHFKGLCAVVKYLCELDNYPNIMEIQFLFEFDENKKAVNELIF